MGTWYETGTISVANGSASVTGTGTEFVANVATGMMLVHDMRVIGEVTSVVSDTALILGKAYTGTAITNSAYAIVNIGSVRDGLINKVGDALTAFNAAQSGALSGRFTSGTASQPGIAFLDEVSLGLRRVSAGKMEATGDLDVDGTLSATVLASGDGVLYARGNILDTVSETSGVPTGGIIERGSDANGEYTRYADGTQECWINLFTTASSAAATWTFPAAFQDNTKISVQATNAETTLRHFSVTTITQTTANIRSWDNSGSEAVTPQCRLHAIGRWFNP